jgi:small-conductance mechanosensitive channel
MNDTSEPMQPMPLTLSEELLIALKAVAACIAVTGASLGVRFLVFHGLAKWVASTATKVDDLVLESLRMPSILWCILTGFYLAVEMAQLPPRPTAIAFNTIYGLLVLSVTAAAANLAGALLRHALREHYLTIPATGLSLTITTVAIWLVGGLVLLSGLGVSIAPILTAVGVGGLAVALALQDTLSNFFAGIHLLIEKPVRMGDFVKLENGQEGYVVDIGWRTTRVRMIPNNMVIIPNNKLTQSILTNYSMPEPRMAVSIRVGVAYGTDPGLVERLLLEEVQKTIGHVPGLLADPAPTVRLIPGFGESSLDFTLSCHVREFEDQFPVQHELRKRILKRFAEEKIDIPYPQRTVHLKTDQQP